MRSYDQRIVVLRDRDSGRIDGFTPVVLVVTEEENTVDPCTFFSTTEDLRKSGESQGLRCIVRTDDVY